MTDNVTDERSVNVYLPGQEPKKDWTWIIPVMGTIGSAISGMIIRGK